MATVLRRLLRFWEFPFLAALASFMFWVRMRPYEALLGGDRAYYIGTDPFYHYRETLGIVRAFPQVPRWDPFTFYPHGTGTGQFGSLFDWLAAAFVVATQGRDAPEAYVATVVGVFPAVLGALLIIPFYFLAKRLVGKWGAIVSAIILALLPGEFLTRSLAGYADHHVAEAAGAIIAILGVFVACERAHAGRDRLVDLRDVRAYWPLLLWGVLGGVALAIDFYAWPAAVLFLGILAIWLSVAILLEDARGGDARGLAFGGAVAFTVAGALMIPSIETTFLGEFNTYGILQPVACFAAALWIVLLNLAARWLKDHDISPWIVPGAAAAVGAAAFFALPFVSPEVYSSFRWGLSWITGIGEPRTTNTIAEARASAFFCQDDGETFSCLAGDFAMVAPMGFLALLALAGFVIWKRRRADLLLLLWSFVIFRATQTQIRFSYYLAINLALLLGWVAARIAEGIALEVPEEATERQEVATKKPAKGRKTRRIQTEATTFRPWKPFAVLAILLLAVPGNVVGTTRSVPSWEAADIPPDSDRFYAIVGDVLLWNQGLDWMRQHTPDAGVDLGLIVQKPPPGEKFDYPDHAYGVLSWWDYGHWIEATALRPPVANPFQQAAPFASIYFTEQDPDAAERMLDEWVGDSPPVRYVIIDDEMATGKFGAITVWASTTNASRHSFASPDARWFVREDRQVLGQTASLVVNGPDYTRSMMGRLYDNDGQGLSHYRLVWESPEYRIIGHITDSRGSPHCVHDPIPSQSCRTVIDRNVALAYVPGTVVPVGEDRFAYDLEVHSRLKLYERVQGARLTGTAPPGAQVEATADLTVDHGGGAGRSFRHLVRGVADAEGKFEIVFPYATTDPIPASRGGTDPFIVATGPVTVVVGGEARRVDVPDKAVLEGLPVPVPG